MTERAAGRPAAFLSKTRRRGGAAYLPIVSEVATGFHFLPPLALRSMCVSAGASTGLPIEAKAASLVPTGAVESVSERERRSDMAGG